MLTDDLYKRYLDGSLDSFLATFDNYVTLNNYREELEQLIKDKRQQLFYDSNNVNIQNSIRVMSEVNDKVFNRMNQFAEKGIWQ